MNKSVATLIAVPAATLAFGACTSAPEFTQFHTPRGGPPIPAVENQFLNDVQHGLDRPLDNDKAIAAGIGASLKCQTYLSPMLAGVQMPNAASLPGLSADDRELFQTAMDMATPDSGLCKAAKAKDDRDRAEAAAAQARAEAETRAHAEQAARDEAAQKAAAAAKTSQRTSAPTSESESSSDGSSSSGSSSSTSTKPPGFREGIDGNSDTGPGTSGGSSYDPYSDKNPNGQEKSSGQRQQEWSGKSPQQKQSQREQYEQNYQKYSAGTGN